VTQLRAEITQQYGELPQRVVNVLLDQVRVDGANPITLDSMRRLIMEMHEADDGPFSRINASIQQLSHQWNPRQTNSTRPTELAVSSASANEQLAAGNLHMVTVGFTEFPSDSDGLATILALYGIFATSVIAIDAVDHTSVFAGRAI